MCMGVCMEVHVDACWCAPSHNENIKCMMPGGGEHMFVHADICIYIYIYIKYFFVILFVFF